MPENTTSDITRGFRSAMKSPTRAAPPARIGFVRDANLLSAIFSNIGPEAERLGAPRSSPISGRFRLDHAAGSRRWWNGGGEDSVHSSVVAPSPHWFSLRRLRPAKTV